MTFPLHNFSQHTAVDVPVDFDPHDVGSSLQRIDELAATIRVSHKPTTVVQQITKSKSTSDLLFEATANAKQWTSQVAMRLKPEAKKMFFRQLDRLHNEDEWFEGDKPIDLESYKAFVRAYISTGIGGKPALALTQRGHLVAIWQNGSNKLTIEFFPRDKARYLVSQVVEGETERFVGDTSISRLPQVLSPFESARWFNGC